MSPTIKDFTILPLILPSLPSYPSDKPRTHTLFLRPNNPKIPTETDTRSLFVVNVPVVATAEHMKGVFAHLLGSSGKVEEVVFEGEKERRQPVPQNADEKSRKRKREGDKDVDMGEVEDLPKTWDRELHRSGGSAVVVFVDRASMEGVLRAVRRLHESKKPETKWPLWGEGVEGKKVPSLGSRRYEAHQRLRFPDPLELQANVDAYMSAFNAMEAARARAAARARNVPDEDGFITVTKGGRTGPAKAEEAQRKKEEAEKRDKERIGEGFYRFQVREKRKREHGEMLKQFEDDRKKVEGMRERRGKGGFRPEN